MASGPLNQCASITFIAPVNMSGGNAKRNTRANPLPIKCPLRGLAGHTNAREIAAYCCKKETKVRSKLRDKASP